ncbi:MAG: hypothetical protein M3R52_01370, partial [Acidobacteriota bacterium]|nr:hypothetical protein [Acidobacteriota bacterium]
MLSRVARDERGTIYVAILFALPPLLQVLGIFLVRSVGLRVFYALVSLLSSGSYLTCWIYYSLHGLVANYVSPICLLFTGFLILIAFLIAMATFKGNSIFNRKSSLARQLASDIGTYPSGEILFFLAFFISIAYLLSFSLAFDDRYRTINGLLPGLRSDIVIDSEDPNRAQVVRNNINQSENTNKKWFVLFRLGSATLDSDFTMNKA